MDTSLSEMRLFIALPTRVTPRLAAMLEHLGGMARAVRAVRPEQVHLTLKFLGDVPSDGVGDVREVIDHAARSIAPFDWSIQGLSAFPTTARPRVVWADCVPAEPLTRLAKLIEDGLGMKGFPRERGEFRPHLTLARVRGPAPSELRQLLESADPMVLAEERADTVVLFRSILEKSGAIHQPLHEAKLIGP